MRFREYTILVALHALGVGTYSHISRWSGLDPRFVWSTLSRLMPYVEVIGVAKTSNNGGSKIYQLTDAGREMAARSFTSARSVRGGS